MPLVPFPAWKPDVTDYEGNASLTISGVLPRGDGYGPVPAPIVYSQALPAACKGAFVAWLSDGTVRIFAGTTNKLYALNNSTLAWADVSKASGTYTALPVNTDNWTFCQFGNLVIACQANARPQYFDLLTSTLFENLDLLPGAIGIPPNAKYVSVVGGFVVLSGITNATGSVAGANPYRIMWSGLNAPGTWDAFTNSSDFQDLPDGGIVRGVAGGESGVILQDNAIRKMTYTQEVTLVFQIERISQDKGLYAPYSLTRAGDTIFFMGGAGVFNLVPGGLPTEIGKAKFNRFLMNDLDRTRLDLVIGASDPRQSRLLLTYRSAMATTSGLFDKIIIYDYLLDKASLLPLTGEYLCTMAQAGTTLENLTANIDTFVGSFDSFGNALTPELAFFDSDHKLNFFRGAPVEAILDTPEQGTDGTRLRVRGIRPIVDAQVMFGSLLKRETVQAAPVITTESAVNAIGMCPLNYSTRYARGRIRIPAGTAWTFAAGAEPDFSLEGPK